MNQQNQGYYRNQQSQQQNQRQQMQNGHSQPRQTVNKQQQQQNGQGYPHSALTTTNKNVTQSANSQQQTISLPVKFIQFKRFLIIM